MTKTLAGVPADDKINAQRSFVGQGGESKSDGISLKKNKA